MSVDRSSFEPIWLAAAGTALALVLGGCMLEHDPVNVAANVTPADPVIVNQVLSSAATQVRRCYRTPRVSTAGKQIITRLAIRLNADGTLAELPSVVWQQGVTPTNHAEASRMAEAATLAVIRCAPLHLPAEHYSVIWDEIELTFSPRARV